ncbi:unnamed protein product [Prunus brigantina]
MADIPLEYTNMPCEVASKPQQSNFCSFLPLLRVVVSFEYLTQFVKIRDQARDRITSTVYILLPNLQTQRFVHLEPDKPPTFCSSFPTSQLHKTMAAVASDKADGQTQWEFSCDLEVDYESEESASIVYAALAVDKELQPDKVKRQMSVSNGKLSVHFEAVEARFLRASYSAFVDVLTLATKTIEEFGKGMEL